MEGTRERRAAVGCLKWNIFHQQLPTHQRDPRKTEESLCCLHLASPTVSQGCGPLKGNTVCMLVCVYMHGMHVEGRARNSQIVATGSGKQLVLGTVFGREVWISLRFRSLCLTNNEIVTTVTFPKEFCRLLFFCQTLTKRLPVCAGQCAWRGSAMVAQSLGLAWTPGHVTLNSYLAEKKACK